MATAAATYTFVSDAAAAADPFIARLRAALARRRLDLAGDAAEIAPDDDRRFVLHDAT